MGLGSGEGAGRLSPPTACLQILLHGCDVYVFHDVDVLYISGM